MRRSLTSSADGDSKGHRGPMLSFDNTPWERLWKVVDNLEQQREQLAWRIRTIPHAPRAGLDTLASVLRK